MILGVCAYLRETGDLAYLDENIDYTDGGSDSVWNHMMRAIEFTLQHRGPQGLPRIGFSDWDDTMNVDHGSGKAESVWCGQQFCRALLDLADLSDHLRKTDDAKRFAGCTPRWRPSSTRWPGTAIGTRAPSTTRESRSV